LKSASKVYQALNRILGAGNAQTVEAREAVKMNVEQSVCVGASKAVETVGIHFK
jgi:hypothetical protein